MYILMNFYKIIFYFISFLPTALLQKELRITKTGVVNSLPYKIGIEFYAELYNTSEKDLHVELIPDECCLKADDGEDCSSLQIIGDCYEVIPHETTKALVLVAPILEPFKRIGYCTIHVDSRPIDRVKNIKRETLNIHFDTTIKEDEIEDLRHCRNTDEDPLNHCKPVNCETYYNGKKSYFNKITKRCAEVHDCIDRKRSENNQIYDPVHNRCVKEIKISEDDIGFLKSLSNKNRPTKDLIIINSGKKPLKHATAKSLQNANNSILMKSKGVGTTLTQYLKTNRITLIVFGLVIIVQIFFIIAIVYCLTKHSCCCKKKLITKFFNYNQDASVTTPLIGTSNIESTTEFFSESDMKSNIKCYKAFQEENSAKSMSDDILTNCLTRRDWSASPKSDTNKEITFDLKSSFYKEVDNSEYNIEELLKENEENNNVIVEHNRNLSEKEVRFHDYFTHSKTGNNEIEHVNICTSVEKSSSISTDKGAQASFSNDSIDDYLSERGHIFLDEHASKNFFNSNSSPEKSSLTGISSKTSKNKILKHVLSFLSKSKTSVASEPGLKKSKSKDVEFIHISQASVHSSSSDIHRKVFSW